MRVFKRIQFKNNKKVRFQKYSKYWPTLLHSDQQCLPRFVRLGRHKPCNLSVYNTHCRHAISTQKNQNKSPWSWKQHVFPRNIWTNLILNCARTQNIIIWVTPGIKICKLTRNNLDNETYEVVFIHSREQLIQQRAADGAVCGLATSAARRYWSGRPPTTTTATSTYIFYIITKRSRSRQSLQNCSGAAPGRLGVPGLRHLSVATSFVQF